MCEFPAHWDFKTIGDFASRVRTKNTGGECQDPMTISAIDGLVSQRDYFNKIVASKNTEGYTLLHTNDFAYNKSYSDGYPVGAVRRLRTKDRGIVSPLYICFELDREQIDLHFADYLFDSIWFVQAIYGIAKEGARSHGLLNIGIEEFFSASLPIPPLPEQKKIAEILSGIDTAINKIATAIVKSDTALTGIFAELDLIAAAGKISTLGEIARVQNGYAFQSSIFTEDSAGIPLVRISNISGGLVDTSKSKRIPQTLAALGEYKVSRGDILIAMSGATTGKIGIYHGSSFCLLNQRVGKFVFRPGSKSIAYATQLLLSGFLESRILAKAAGGAQPNISGKGIEAIEIPFPDTAEQDKYAITIQEFLRVNAKRRILMEKYQHLKSALSSDLLSGRKRVSI